ncbi:MAG: hypothetical protein HON99_10940, partial [Crocinitomicaceae bacterium]|nr:hypothetical protein [Crocinitomicaceae bacterium]
MPKPHTFPTLYNDALQIDISKLKEWKYLNSEQVKSGTLNWSRNGQQTGSISITVNTRTEKPFVQLDYRYKDQPRNYKVRLVSMPSNLGKGVIWFFLCPETNKRCRKLYSIGGYFYHREAFNGCMYESQTHSKKYRELDKTLGAYLNTDNLYEQLYKKHFKQTYAGKPTKKYLRIMKQLERAKSIPYDEFERLL